MSPVWDLRGFHSVSQSVNVY